MLCARVMRGISSIDSSVAPVAATSRIACGAPSGSAKPITTWPACSAVGRPASARTCRTMSAVPRTSARESDRRALRRVGVVGEPGGDARAGFDDDLEPGLDERRDAGGIDGDPRLAGEGFFRDSDSHRLKSNRSPDGATAEPASAASRAIRRSWRPLPGVIVFSVELRVLLRPRRSSPAPAVVHAGQVHDLDGRRRSSCACAPARRACRRDAAAPACRDRPGGSGSAA